MKKKDILFLCQFFYPEYISSAQLPYDTVLALKNAGFSVDVLCGYPKEYYSGSPVPLRDDSLGFFIHRLKYIQLGRKGILGRLINYFSFTLAVFLHLGDFRRYRSVVVYSNPPILPWIAAAAKGLFGTKLVFVCYDAYPEVATRMGSLRPGSLICRLMEHINRAVYTRADAVVALGSEMKEFLSTARPISPEKITVIPNWAEDKKAAAVSDNPYKIPGKFVISYFGNMGVAQDMQTIYDAVKLLKDHRDIHFLFAGHGSKKQVLTEAIERDGLENVTMLDFLQGADFCNALAASDASLVSLEKGLCGICVPSKTYSYMMQGLPLLAVLEGGDIVTDIQSGAGICVKNDCARNLADAVLTMAADLEKTQAMGRRSREIYLEKYTCPIATAQYVDLMRRLLR